MSKNRTEITTQEAKSLFLPVLAMQMGNISETCRLVGISRRTYYLWQDSDTEFAQDCALVSETMLDFVEERMYMAIQNLDSSLIKFVLTTKGKHRGYGSGKDQGSNDRPSFIQINQQFNAGMPPQPTTLADWEVQVKDARAKRKLLETPSKPETLPIPTTQEEADQQAALLATGPLNDPSTDQEMNHE